MADIAQHWIDGEWVDSDIVDESINPATREVLGAEQTTKLSSSLHTVRQLRA